MKKRSDLSIMLRLIKLVKPLAGYMTAAYGLWLCYDEPCAYGEGDTCGGMGLPYHILCIRRKDHKNRKIGKRHNNAKHSHIRGRLS